MDKNIQKNNEDAIDIDKFLKTIENTKLFNVTSIEPDINDGLFVINMAKKMNQFTLSEKIRNAFRKAFPKEKGEKGIGKENNISFKRVNDNIIAFFYNQQKIFKVNYNPKLNKGTLYEKKLLDKSVKIAKNIAKTLGNKYRSDQVEKTKIDGKEVDMRIGNSNIEIKYASYAREGSKLSRVNFAGLGLNEDYQNTTFYQYLPNYAKKEVDKFFLRNKEKVNTNDKISIPLPGTACMLLFDNHYKQSQYIQIHKMGIYSIRNSNPANINEIKPIDIKSGNLVLRIKANTRKKSDNTYYFQMKAEITDCVVPIIYGQNNLISLDNEIFLEKFVSSALSQKV